LGAVITQVGAILLLYNQKMSKVQFLLFELLHIGIFISSGIFFWKWIILNALLYTAVIYMSDDLINAIYSKTSFYISVMIIVTSMWTFKPFKLAWFDTGTTWRYEFVAETTDNQTFTLQPEFWAPYDITFAQARFNYVDQYPVLLGTFGTVSIVRDSAYEIYKNFMEVPDEEILSYIDKNGKKVYSDGKKERLQSFVQTFIVNYNNKQDAKNKYILKIGPPYHIYQFPQDGTDNPGQINNVKLLLKYYTNVDGSLKLLHSKSVLNWSFK
jgi:hypothetical protein